MKKLKGLIEELVEGEEKMARVASDYFKGMFTASQTMSCYNMLFGIPNCIQEGMNNELIAKFWVEEVVEVAKSMTPLKESGMDGYPALFYQIYWYIV